MKLCIDNRERQRIPLFQSYINSGKTTFIDGIETDNYQVGDYLTKDLSIGIEYKRDDYFTSLFEGKLDQQLKELEDNFEKPFLFIGYESIMDMISSNPLVNPDISIGSIASILVRHDVNVVFVGDFLVPVTCKMIEKFYDGKTEVKLTEYTPIRNKATTGEIKRAMLEKIPHFGPKKVNKIIDLYDIKIVDKQTQQTPTVQELAEIKIGKKKLGEKLAQKILDVLR